MGFDSNLTDLRVSLGAPVLERGDTVVSSFFSTSSSLQHIMQQKRPYSHIPNSISIILLVTLLKKGPKGAHVIYTERH